MSAPLEKGEKLLWKYEETRYFVFLSWSDSFILTNLTKSEYNNWIVSINDIIFIIFQVEWEEIEPEEDEAALKNPSVTQWLVKTEKKGSVGGSVRVHPYFRERCLTSLTTLWLKMLKKERAFFKSSSILWFHELSIINPWNVLRILT